jgi:hypothetical protein
LFAKHYAPSDALIYSAIIVGAVTLIISIAALSGLDETFGKELDYIET